jgi:hypothetical protein
VNDFRKALTLLKEQSRIARVNRLLNETVNLEKKASTFTFPSPFSAGPDEIGSDPEIRSRFW